MPRRFRTKRRRLSRKKRFRRKKRRYVTFSQRQRGIPFKGITKPKQYADLVKLHPGNPRATADLVKLYPGKTWPKMETLKKPEMMYYKGNHQIYKADFDDFMKQYPNARFGDYPGQGHWRNEDLPKNKDGKIPDRQLPPSGKINTGPPPVAWGKIHNSGSPKDPLADRNLTFGYMKEKLWNAFVYFAAIPTGHPEAYADMNLNASQYIKDHMPKQIGLGHIGPAVTTTAKPDLK